jgi:hypothetical protein
MEGLGCSFHSDLIFLIKVKRCCILFLCDIFYLVQPLVLFKIITHFPKSLPLSHFPQTVPTLPFIRPFVRLRRHILHQHLFFIQPMV